MIPQCSMTDPAIIETAARVLIARMEEITEHPAYKSVWTVNQLHVGPYAGPNWKPQFDALKAALAGKDTVTPLIRADALEKAARAFEPDEDGHDSHHCRFTAEEIAAAIRALKPASPSPSADSA